MTRFHSLMSFLRPGEDDYKKCQSAVKFDLGDWTNVMTLSHLSRQEIWELPAPVCLFQMRVGSVHWFYLAWELENNTAWRQFKIDGHMGHVKDIEVYISKFSGFPIGARRSTGEPLNADILPDGSIRNWDQKDTPNDIIEEISPFRTMAEAIEVFSCSNVVTKEHSPSKFINNKRIKKGKAPFFSYRTLHITGETTAKVEATGTHGTPRLHFRRGHIRRLGSGKRVWVQKCLVGDKTKGFAAHDYAVDAVNP